MKQKKYIFLLLAVIYLSSCDVPSKEKVNSQEQIILKHKQSRKNYSKEKIIMNEFEEMKKELEPLGYEITTDSVSYIYLDHSVKMKFN